MDGTSLGNVDVNELLSMAGMVSGGSIDWISIVASLIFGTIGFFAFMHGKKHKSARPTIIGIILMVYPYFMPGGAWGICLAGAVLTALLYFWQE